MLVITIAGINETLIVIFHIYIVFGRLSFEVVPNSHSIAKYLELYNASSLEILEIRTIELVVVVKKLCIRPK